MPRTDVPATVAPRPDAVGVPTGASVRFTRARRPEEATVVRIASFDGPLALLLALIEARQLDVLTVRLGDLAAAYVEALARLPGDRIPHLSSFVAVSSQLIVIKSRELLPRPPAQAIPVDEERGDAEEELRERLLQYRTFRDAGRRLAERLETGARLYHREAPIAVAAAARGARAPDPPVLDPTVLVRALTRSVELAPAPPPPAAVVPRTITLEEQATVIRAALRDAPELVLQDLLREVDDRVVIAVTFLAMLELAKGREIAVDQEVPWGPIRVRAIGRPARPVAPA